MNNRSKKDIIISYAKTEPFLTVEEIAEKASTTSQYVRTVLSTAGVSLTCERQKYVRGVRIDDKLIHITIPKTDEGITSVLKAEGKDVSVEGIRIMQVSSPGLAALMHIEPDRPLLSISRVKCVNGRPFYVTKVTTYKNIAVSEDMLNIDRSLRQILGLEIEGSTIFVDRSLEVEQADEYLSGSLNIREGDPVFVAVNVILTNGERVGVESNMFNASGIRFVMGSDSHYSLQIMEKELSIL